MHRRARTLHSELRAAERALAEEDNEANLAWLREVQNQLSSVEGAEADMDNGSCPPGITDVHDGQGAARQGGCRSSSRGWLTVSQATHCLYRNEFRVVEACSACRPFAHRGPAGGMPARALELSKAWRRRQPNGDEGETTAPEQQSDGPLLDLTDAAVKRMIKLAKKRGYVTYDELNEVLPSEEFTSEQIEDVLGQLSEMGINVVESEEADESAPSRERRRGGSRRAASSSRPRRPAPSSSARPRPRSRPTAPTIRCACTCARWARSSCCPARARSPSPSASRPAARR